MEFKKIEYQFVSREIFVGTIKNILRNFFVKIFLSNVSFLSKLVEIEITAIIKTVYGSNQVVVKFYKYNN